jgi:hypothetical protein
VDVLLLANHADNMMTIKNGVIIDVKRGECGYSFDALSKRWRWSRGKVKRFMKYLKTQKMVQLRSDGNREIIVICNYDNYQTDSKRTVNGHLTDSKRTVNGQLTDINNNDNKGNNEDKGNPLHPGDEDPPTYKTKKGRILKERALEAFEEFWNAFGYKQGKAEAADAFYDVRPGERLLAVIVKAAKAEAARRPGLIRDGKTPIMAQGWLTGRRWEDEHQSQPTRRGKTDLNFGPENYPSSTAGTPNKIF